MIRLKSGYDLWIKCRAKSTTVIFLINITALINNLDIQKYLIYILNKLDKMPIENMLPYASLLPVKLKILIKVR